MEFHLCRHPLVFLVRSNTVKNRLLREIYCRILHCRDFVCVKLLCDPHRNFEGERTLSPGIFVGRGDRTQRRRRVWRFRRGPSEFVISGCIAPSHPPPPLKRKLSPDFYVSCGPRWAAQAGSGLLDPHGQLRRWSHPGSTPLRAGKQARHFSGNRLELTFSQILSILCS